MFGRRRPPHRTGPGNHTRPVTSPAGGAPVAAWLSSTPSVVPPPPPADNLTAGWAPAGVGQAPWEQIGAYRGQLRSRFPAMPKGVMLQQGVESLQPRWYYPTVNPAAQTNPLIVRRHLANLPGAQRRGSQFTGPIGPVNVGQFSPQVVAAQIRQSGLQVQPWARPLVD